MDYKDLGKAVLSTAGLAVFSIVVVFGLIFLVNNFSTQTLAGLLMLLFFGFGVKIDYDRRQFIKTLRK